MHETRPIPSTLVGSEAPQPYEAASSVHDNHPQTLLRVSNVRFVETVNRRWSAPGLSAGYDAGWGKEKKPLILPCELWARPVE